MEVMADSPALMLALSTGESPAIFTYTDKDTEWHCMAAGRLLFMEKGAGVENGPQGQAKEAGPVISCGLKLLTAQLMEMKLPDTRRANAVGPASSGRSYRTQLDIIIPFPDQRSCVRIPYKMLLSMVTYTESNIISLDTDGIGHNMEPTGTPVMTISSTGTRMAWLLPHPVSSKEDI